jgi:hypothetical protein
MGNSFSDLEDLLIPFLDYGDKALKQGWDRFTSEKLRLPAPSFPLF